jgi:hypothetical protein
MGRSISQSKYTYLRGQQNQLTDMKSLEVKPELAEFPEPSVPSEEEQNNPDSENNPDLLFDDKSQ